jgi:hypothetical protein
VAPIPDGVYAATITVDEAMASDDPHIVVLSAALAGSYQLTIADGQYQVTKDGKDTVPYRIPDRPGVEGGYIKYGYWVFRGVPPIGSGRYDGDASLVAFHSLVGACFQPGASPAILNGLYRWAVSGSRLTFSAVGEGDAPAEGAFGAGVDDCLGRTFVLTEHPWVPVA